MGFGFFLNIRKARLPLKWIGCSSSFISWSTPESGRCQHCRCTLGGKTCTDPWCLKLCWKLQLWEIFRHGAGGKRETRCGSCCLHGVFMSSCLWNFYTLSCRESLLWNSQEIRFGATQDIFSPFWQCTVWFDPFPFFPSPVNKDRQNPALSYRTSLSICRNTPRDRICLKKSVTTSICWKKITLVWPHGTHQPPG